tara:strand:+ start:91 stop:393 length:303 start_codon:yes stop_codon:yes gene_type:complete
MCKCGGHGATGREGAVRQERQQVQHSRRERKSAARRAGKEDNSTDRRASTARSLAGERPAGVVAAEREIEERVIAHAADLYLLLLNLVRIEERLSLHCAA